MTDDNAPLVMSGASITYVHLIDEGNIVVLRLSASDGLKAANIVRWG
jgi:hypothetical protein